MCGVLILVDLLNQEFESPQMSIAISMLNASG